MSLFFTGRKTQKSPKVVRPLPAATRRSQRVKRTIKHQHNENDSSDDGEYSFQPKRRAFQPKKKETTPPKAVATPGAGMDSFFFSQTPVAPSNVTASSGSATQQTIPEKQSSTANESSFVSFLYFSCHTSLYTANSLDNGHFGSTSFLLC